ncbi:IMP cyclohydrolase [Desulfovibrio sp. OttesenSCG-928-M16]|nr:IMP cyclohydrolase [Desulfovibrio sp. OttesenSCG-928-M16]
MDFLPIKRAILSVTDKSGLAEFASFLAAGNVELVSTGGTCAMLRASCLAVVEVSEVTRFPEIMDGRVKTLHPAIHGGILADKDKPEHLATIAAHSIAPFDLVCVNLYDFAQAAAKGLDLRASVEQIDIGGPCMLRAAAKNYHSVMVIPDPSWYPRIKESLSANAMQAPLALRQELAAATFAATSAYDGMIAAYLQKQR